VKRVLINVLKGDMSIIGPRPLLVQYLELYTPEEAVRHDIRPGLIGLAQVSGRTAISWQEKFKLDVDYVKNINFMLDLKIFFVTFKKLFVWKDVCLIEGFSSDMQVTREVFDRENGGVKKY